MPKFKVGDVVVPVKVKSHMNTATHRNYRYVDGMYRLMMAEKTLKVFFSDEDCVKAGDYNWHPDDLELYQLDLENK